MGALAAAGLLYDIAGVLLLGWALLMPSRVDHFVLSAPFYDGNSALFLALRKQKLDAYCGLALLVLGFTLQFLSNVGIGGSLRVSVSIAIASLVIGFPFLLIGHKHLATTNAREFRTASEEYKKMESLKSNAEV